MAISETRKRFNDAFRSARNSGEGTFEFEGKKYTTKLSEEKSPEKTKTVTDTGDELQRMVKRSPKADTYENRVASIPNEFAGQNRSGPEFQSERVSGSEFGRNVSNTLNALAPMAPGVGKIAAELATAGRAQKAYNTLANARRAEEGFSPAEALASRAPKALSEADTAGGAMGYKRGGKVKKMSYGGMTHSAASKRADGIATKGKTKGRYL
jgi:hypothetical protein